MTTSEKLYVASRIPADWPRETRRGVCCELNGLLAAHNRHTSFAPDAWDTMFAAGEWIVALAGTGPGSAVIGLMEIEHLVLDDPSSENRAIIHRPMFGSMENFRPDFVVKWIIQLACETTIARLQGRGRPYRVILMTGTPTAREVAARHGFTESNDAMVTLASTPIAPAAEL